MLQHPAIRALLVYTFWRGETTSEVAEQLYRIAS